MAKRKSYYDYNSICYRIDREKRRKEQAIKLQERQKAFKGKQQNESLTKN